MVLVLEGINLRRLRDTCYNNLGKNVILNAKFLTKKPQRFGGYKINLKAYEINLKGYAHEPQ